LDDRKGGIIELTSPKSLIREKMIYVAFKENFSQLARKYDPNLVFELWAKTARNGGIKDYFSNWRWKSVMTIAVAIAHLNDYFTALEGLLQKTQARKK
jgi:hypothetical protein